MKPILLTICLLSSVIYASAQRASIEEYAKICARKYMETLTRYTGRDVRGEVIRYNYVGSNEYRADVRLIWDAKGCMLCDYGIHEVLGTLVVNLSTGHYVFNPTWENKKVEDTRMFKSLNKIVINEVLRN